MGRSYAKPLLYDREADMRLSQGMEGMDDVNRVGDFLNRPRRAYMRLQKAIDSYDALRASVEGRAVRYDNPLGVRVQTSPGNIFEDRMLDLNDAETRVKRALILYNAEMLTVRNVLSQLQLSDVQRRVVWLRTYPIAPTYDEIAAKVGLKDGPAARYQDVKATAQVALQYKG